jgi:hypothetical protein
MGLINLQTNLKSLGFGRDRKGGGSSNQPYVTTPIPEGDLPTSPDFLLRNGYLNPVNSIQDVKRLSKFFTDVKTPSGLLFTIKQQLLERQNPKLVNVNRIYNPLGTLAQVGLNSLGFHVNKQGLNNAEPSYFNGGRYGYYYATKGLGVNPIAQLIPGEGYENRLTIAYTAKIEKKPLGPLTINPFGVTNLAGNGILLSYPGGPNSPLGLGITNIRIQNPTRIVDLPKNRTIFSLKPEGTDIANKNYLTYTGAPNINWVYNPSTNGFGVSNQVIFDLDLENNQDIFFTDNVNNILNRDASVNKPEDREQNTFNHGSLLKSNPNYLVPSSIDSSHIVYQYQVSSSGVTEAAIDRFKTITDTKPLENINKLYFSEANSAGTVDIFRKNIDESNDVFTFDTDQILNNPSAGKLKDTNFQNNVIDFRSKINASEGRDKIVSTNYSSFNRENKNESGEGYGTSQTSYKGNFKNGQRVLNPNVAISNDQYEQGTNGEDIIDFNFRILNPAGKNNADKSEHRLIDFRAYLESWNDGVKANYNDVRYMGRAESFYKYGGFSRDSSISFLVPALSRGDMMANYRKVNMMMWSVAPNYSNIGLMRGNITEVTMGSYFRSMPSIIKSVDVVEIEGMGWDINRNQEGKVIDFPTDRYKDNIGFKNAKDFATPTAEDFYTGQLPKGLKITVQFTPIHQFTPEYGQAFIGQNQIFAGPLWNNSGEIARSPFHTSEERNYFQANP